MSVLNQVLSSINKTSFYQPIHPKIKPVFESGRLQIPLLLMSNLKKMKKLKSCVVAGNTMGDKYKTKHNKKKNITLLFDMVLIRSKTSTES
jgi:hypothetical protein